MVDLSIDSVGHEQSGVRPCLVIQNDILNETSDNVIVIPLTSQQKRYSHFIIYYIRKIIYFFVKMKPLY